MVLEHCDSDTVSQILRYLSLHDLLNFSATCKEYRRFVLRDDVYCTNRIADRTYCVSDLANLSRHYAKRYSVLCNVQQCVVDFRPLSVWERLCNGIFGTNKLDTVASHEIVHRLQNIEHLTFTRYAPHGDTLNNLHSNHRLSTIWLVDCNDMTDGAFAIVASIPGLKCLHIKGSTGCMTAAACKSIGASQKLEALYFINGLPELSPGGDCLEDVMALVDMVTAPKLEQLTISLTNVDMNNAFHVLVSSSFANLYRASNPTNIKHVVFAMIADRAHVMQYPVRCEYARIVEVLAELPTIELIVISCNMYTFRDVETPRPSMPLKLGDNLKTVILNGVVLISNTMANQLLEHPSIETLILSGQDLVHTLEPSTHSPSLKTLHIQQFKILSSMVFPPTSNIEFLLFEPTNNFTSLASVPTSVRRFSMFSATSHFTSHENLYGIRDVLDDAYEQRTHFEYLYLSVIPLDVHEMPTVINLGINMADLTDDHADHLVAYLESPTCKVETLYLCIYNPYLTANIIRDRTTRLRARCDGLCIDIGIGSLDDTPMFWQTHKVANSLY